MNVLVNGITLNVNNAYAERENGITLFIHVPQSEMGYSDLKEIFKNNTGDIIKTDGDNVETFSGFAYANIADDDANGVYVVKLTANEYDFQVGRNRQLEADKASLEGTVASKEAEISNLNVTVSEQEKAIAEKEEEIVSKNATISEKETVIEEKEVIITELEATLATKDEELVAKDAEIAELLTIAEEYAEYVFNNLEEDVLLEESEVM